MTKELWPDDQNEEFGDWRIAQVGRLASALPAAYPGGPSHKVGTPVYPSPTSIRHPTLNNVNFITPSPTAMAINVAIKAAREAIRLRRTVAFIDVPTPTGPGKMVANENLLHLYDYFESFMIAATFSYQALETFANGAISTKLKSPFKLERRGDLVEFTPIELERAASTEEKLSVVLPELYQKESPRGKVVWQKFVKFKRARDSTIHLKSYQANPTQVDQTSLFWEFLNHQATELPRTAMALIEYFMGDDVPRWVLYGKRFMD